MSNSARVSDASSRDWPLASRPSSRCTKNTAPIKMGTCTRAATRVNIEKTGEWNRLPKFENVAPDLAEDEEHHIIQLTSEDS